MAKEAVFPAANFNFERNVEDVSEVLMSPFELLFTDFTNVTLLEPDLPVMEHNARRALETVYESFLFAVGVFALNRRDNEDLGFIFSPASFKTGN